VQTHAEAITAWGGFAREEAIVGGQFDAVANANQKLCVVTLSSTLSQALCAAEMWASLFSWSQSVIPCWPTSAFIVPCDAAPPSDLEFKAFAGNVTLPSTTHATLGARAVVVVPWCVARTGIECNKDPDLPNW
jgi:hypothetical protein